jgi:hypothetical protein
MVTLDESKYKDKLNTVPESGVYETLPKICIDKVKSKVQKFLSKHKITLAAIWEQR